MTEYREGQRVRVEWEGVVERQSSENILVIQASEGHSIFIDPTRDVKITLLGPAGWPPQVGDIWEADGQEYHGEEWRRTGLEPVSFVLQPYSHTDDTWAYSDEGGYAKKLDDFKALNPVLTRRRGQ